MTKCARCGYEAPKPLKINIYGGGSAGQRHARMLRERGHECRIYDPQVYPQGNLAYMYDHPDAVVIASPPETHEQYLKEWWDKCPILCEGPVTWANPMFSTRQGITSDRFLPQKFPHMTASNWLFVPQLHALWRKLVTTNAEPVSAHLWFDYDLARWRSNWDYRASCYYESGIDLINCHEAMTALWLFGPAQSVRVFSAHTGKSAGQDALVAAMLHANSVLTTINSGWHAASYQRGVRVVFKDGTVEEIGWNSPGSDDICNQSYSDMIDHWLAAIASNDVNVRPNLLDGYRAFKLMQGEAIP